MTSTVRLATIKLAVAMVFDAADLLVGLFPVPGPGTVWDAIMSVVGVVLFGWRGLFQLWELANVPFDLVDGFVPTLTLIALVELRRAKKGEAEKNGRMIA